MGHKRRKHPTTKQLLSVSLWMGYKKDIFAFLPTVLNSRNCQSGVAGPNSYLRDNIPQTICSNRSVEQIF